MSVGKIYIGSDHAGFEAKQSVVRFLKKNKYVVEDLGPYNDSSVDYPDFAHQVASSVRRNGDSLGILLCGSGNGVCMTANKHDGIRAGLVWNEEIASLIKQHNNANIICLPARFLSTRKLNACVNAFLNTEFEGGRHQRRIDKISCV